MASQNFEFAIQMGAVIARHPNLIFANLTNVGFLEEEVIFLGLALSNSKNMLSLHLTGNKLSYINRIFLRTLMAARVEKRRKVNLSSQIKNNVDYNQVMHLANEKN
jgi:hypothetical protein